MLIFSFFRKVKYRVIDNECSYSYMCLYVSQKKRVALKMFKSTSNEFPRPSCLPNIILNLCFFHYKYTIRRTTIRDTFDDIFLQTRYTNSSRKLCFISNISSQFKLATSCSEHILYERSKLRIHD